MEGEWGEEATEEIGAALTMTRRAADDELEIAWGLTHRFPQIGDALREGRIDLRRARTLMRGIGHLESDLAHQVAEAALVVAPNLTAGQLAAHVRKLCIELPSATPRSADSTPSVCSTVASHPSVR